MVKNKKIFKEQYHEYLDIFPHVKLEKFNVVCGLCKKKIPFHELFGYECNECGTIVYITKYDEKTLNLKKELEENKMDCENCQKHGKCEREIIKEKDNDFFLMPCSGFKPKEAKKS